MFAPTLLQPAVTLGEMAQAASVSFSPVPDITQVSAPVNDDPNAAATVTSMDVMTVADTALETANQLQALLDAGSGDDTNPNENGTKLADCGNGWIVIDHNETVGGPELYQSVGLYRTGHYVRLDHHLNTGVRGARSQHYFYDLDSVTVDKRVRRVSRDENPDVKSTEITGLRIEVEMQRAALAGFLTRIQSGQPDVFGSEYSATNFPTLSAHELGIIFGALYTQATGEVVETLADGGYQSVQQVTDAVHLSAGCAIQDAPRNFSFYLRDNQITITQHMGAGAHDAAMPLLLALARAARLQAFASQTDLVADETQPDGTLHFVRTNPAAVNDADLVTALSTLPNMDDDTRLRLAHSIVDWYAPRFAGTVESDPEAKFPQELRDAFSVDQLIPIPHARTLMIASGLRREQIENYVNDCASDQIHVTEIIETLGIDLRELRENPNAYRTQELTGAALRGWLIPAVVRGELGSDGMRELERLSQADKNLFAKVVEVISDGLERGSILNDQLARALPGTWLERHFLGAFAARVDGMDNLIIADWHQDGARRDLIQEVRERSAYLAGHYRRVRASYEELERPVPAEISGATPDEMGDGEGDESDRTGPWRGDDEFEN